MPDTTDDSPGDDRTVEQPFRVGDPVVDLAQAQPMIVLEAPTESVAAWSDAHEYQLTENYANGKLNAAPDEAVVRCAYVANIRSEPSKDYTFPVSRVALIDAHHADDGRRIHDRVAHDVLEQLFAAAYRSGSDQTLSTLQALAHDAVDTEVARAARELASVQHTIPGDDAERESDG
jgi:hypothetical protein